MTQWRKLHFRDAFRGRIVIVAVLVAASFGERRARAEDWPQWRGPRRDAVSEEKGLLQSWPAGGPKVAWQASGFGTGYSSVVVGGGRLLTMGRKESDVVVTALDAATGKPVWTRKIGETTRHPCSTPTLDGDHLYVLDPDGDLVCLQAATGEVVWQTSFIDNFAGRMMSGRGYGESPLIDGERLICTPGGADAALVALDKLTGNVVWKAKLPELGPLGKDGAGFSSVVVTLRHLVANTNLLALDLELCDGITDNACEPLGAMKQLRTLVLKKSGFERQRISDAGIKQLAQLAHLEVLNLYGNNVTDDGLMHLRPLKKLRELNLSLLAISDAGLEHLQPLTALEHLELLYSEGFAGPTLTNGMVESLKPLTNLTSLNLTGAKLTDTGLEGLRVLKKLKTLQVVRTRVTAEGIQAFRAAVPTCEIIR